MKILHINSYYNGENFYKNLYNKQEEEGLKIEVYVPVTQNTDISNPAWGGYTKVSKNHSKYDRLFFHVKHKKIYNDIRKKYSLENFSLAHAHSLFSNGYIAMKLKAEYNLPYIVAVRNTDVNLFFKRMLHLRNLGVNILREASKIIFLSKSYRDLVIEKYVPENLKENFYKKSVVIPNGIDDFWFTNIDEKKTNPISKNLKLLYVGDINKNKNIVTSIKSIEILEKNNFKVDFTIVGKIKDKDIYEIMKKNPSVHYIPRQPKDLLINIYRNNDIFIMPSITETFGLVYAEALSQGLPVVYSRGQGFDRQFEEGQVGYHVHATDSDDIAQKILAITKEYILISNRCIENSKVFEWGKITKKYNDIYNNVFN